MQRSGYCRAPSLATSALILFGSASLVMGPLPVSAQSLPPSEFEGLEQRLQKKYKPAPKKTLEEPAAVEKTPKSVDDYLFLEQKTTPPARKVAPGTRGDVSKSNATWYQSVYDFFSEKIGISASVPATAPETASAPAAEPPGAFEGESQDARTLFPRTRAAINKARGLVRRIARKVPVAKPNSYVISLNPDAKDTEIDALLKKYDLTVTKIIPELGMLTVEQASKAKSAEERPRASSPTGALSNKQRLQEILEPQLIRDLRKEAIVDGAFVNNTMGTRGLPKPKGASIKVGQETVSWRWAPGQSVDGNWGLKAIRMPAVWGLLKQARRTNPDLTSPKIGIVDGGFFKSDAVPFDAMLGTGPGAFHKASCATHHGMHVAGIIGGRQTSKPGIDGIVPAARMDAIGVGSEIIGDAGVLGIEEGWQLHTLLFDEVLGETLNYVIDSVLTQQSPLVINISLGYNFIAADLLDGDAPDDVPGLRAHINHQANLIRKMANRFKDHVIIVVAAGNDSHGLETPIEAKWASPFAWAGTQASSAADMPPNILVVEAVDRDGRRATFSNIGGHVSAPGVDIMSTLGEGANAFGLCSGTSQAAPHVTGLAALMLELDPSRKPPDVVEAIKTAAQPTKIEDGAAPMIDALDSVIKNSVSAVAQLADLDSSGKVDDADLRIFARHMQQIAEAATENKAFTDDLNGDGVVDDNECFFPRIDLNGSGRGTTSPKDRRSVLGLQKTDRTVLGLAWNDPTRSFDVALAAAGLNPENTIFAAFGKLEAPRPKCRGLIKVAGPGVTPVPGGTSLVPAGGEDGRTSDATAIKKQVLDATEDLKKSNPKLRVVIDPATGLPSRIIGLKPQTDASALGASGAGGELTEQETKAAVDAFFGQAGIRSLHPSENASSRQEYVGRRRDPDFPGRYVAEVEQRVDGVRVFGSSAKLTVQRSLGVTSYNGKMSAVAIDSVKPDITSSEAISLARTKLKELLRSAPGGARALQSAVPDKAEVKDPELTIFDPALVRRKPGPTRLAWVVTIEGFKIFIDAKTGAAFHYFRDRPSGMIRRIYDMGGRAVFPTDPGIDEGTGSRSEGLSADTLSAFRNAGFVRDYFFLNFGRGSFDDTDGAGGEVGSALEAYVGYGQTQNAYWCSHKSYDCPKPNVMVYGPGYAGAIDIVAHEMTHGVIAHESKLQYFDEPGAVNEALSDIFGTLIELQVRGAAGNWVIGEASPGFSITSPLRSLADPNLRDDNGNSLFQKDARFSLANRGQPDHYSDVLTPDDEICGSTAYDDNGCVHFNSGILNKLAFLATEGGTHSGVTVEPIGATKLGRIAYRVMTIGLNPTSGLREAADSFVIACAELANARLADITEFDCRQIEAAQMAVGLGPPEGA